MSQTHADYDQANDLKSSSIRPFALLRGNEVKIRLIVIVCFFRDPLVLLAPRDLQ